MLVCGIFLYRPAMIIKQNDRRKAQYTGDMGKIAVKKKHEKTMLQ
jgi:hypothetical protein